MFFLHAFCSKLPKSLRKITDECSCDVFVILNYIRADSHEPQDEGKWQDYKSRTVAGAT
jgi:hypothetical protein